MAIESPIRQVTEMRTFKEEIITSNTDERRLRAISNFILGRTERLQLIGEVAYAKGELGITEDVAKMLARIRTRRQNGTE